jgi:hypothetical protein
VHFQTSHFASHHDVHRLTTSTISENSLPVLRQITRKPTKTPTRKKPTAKPKVKPTAKPRVKPMPKPIPKPTLKPTPKPTPSPTLPPTFASQCSVAQAPEGSLAIACGVFGISDLEECSRTTRFESGSLETPMPTEIGLLTHAT